MIRRTLKTAILATAAYYAARQIAQQRKLLAVRAEAKAEMDRLETILKDLYAEDGGFDLTKREKSDLFNDTLKQLSKWTRVHAKTL